MRPSRLLYRDVTISNPTGATPQQPQDFKPLNTAKWMNWTHRRTAVEQAPSLIGGKLVPALGGQQ